MFSLKQTLVASLLLALANGQGVIQSAKGDQGESKGFQVNLNDDNDANIISDTEISANVVNECGRTIAKGNIDAGENAEIALSDNQITQVTKGSTVDVSIRQVNGSGAGPYTCDMDETGNTKGATGQTQLDVEESDADDEGNINLKVTMPDDMACIGSSTGDVCTVRCRNENEFGGCFAVQQTDTTPSENEPGNIDTAQDLKGIESQIQQNLKDLQAAMAGIAASSQDTAEQGVNVVDAIQQADPDTKGLLAAGKLDKRRLAKMSKRDVNREVLRRWARDFIVRGL
ncbi:hypothetical protein F4780DRAFT_329258 [Xylariomycetidae sp. FL0641]|nr:hypothetical protein F4780DRAFT_329258 [Xylariomycetidae sp. FL0641]